MVALIKITYSLIKLENMKKTLRLGLLIALFGTANLMQAQNTKLERYILVTDTITDEGVTFSASSDDAEQENDAIDALYDDDLDAGWEGAPEDFNTLTVGLRFRDLNIPQGATIDSAFIILVSHEGKSTDDVSVLTLWAEATDDAVTFDEQTLITDRTPTNAKVLWTVEEEWTLFGTYKTPYITSVVQEVINRANWKNGNALAIVVEGENQGASDFENAREFESFENIADPEDGGDGQNHPDRVPQLVVYYTAEGANGIANTPATKQLSIYPNPAQNTVTLTLPNTGNGIAEFYNLQGQLVKTATNVNGDAVINTSQLVEGVYIVKVLINNEFYTSRLIIKK